MKKLSLTSMIVSGFCLVTADAGHAEDMEKCKIIGADGKGLIKAKMCDCAAGGYSCAGSNPEGDPNAWVFLPKGVCEKIKGGCIVGAKS